MSQPLIQSDMLSDEFSECASFGVHRGERLYTVKEVADIVLGGMSQRFVRDLIKHGQIEVSNIAVHLNGRPEYVITERAIDDFLRRRAINAGGSVPLAAVKPSRAKQKSVKPDSFYAKIEAHLRERGAKNGS